MLFHVHHHEKIYINKKEMHLLLHSYISVSGNNWAATWQNQQSGCVSSEESDQPGHPPSLISLHAWKKLGSLATHWAHSEDSIRLGGCPGWSESSLGALFLLVLSCGGSYADSDDFVQIHFFILKKIPTRVNFDFEKSVSHESCKYFSHANDAGS